MPRCACAQMRHNMVCSFVCAEICNAISVFTSIQASFKVKTACSQLSTLQLEGLICDSMHAQLANP